MSASCYGDASGVSIRKRWLRAGAVGRGWIRHIGSLGQFGVRANTILGQRATANLIGYEEILGGSPRCNRMNI